MQSLAQFLGVLPDQDRPADEVRLENLTAKEFAEAVLNSSEFHNYVINALRLGELPSAVICRMMDYAWGKPPERVEHTGKDGKPIETVTEVRRVIVRVNLDQEQEESPTYIMH